MTTSKPQPTQADNLAAWTWIAVTLTPVGWFFGALAIAFSYEGDHPVVRSVIIGLLLFAAAPTSAVVLAVHAARAGHRSGKIAVIVSGLLLLATLVYLTLWIWWIGLAVTAVVAVLVLAGCAPAGSPWWCPACCSWPHLSPRGRTAGGSI